MEKMSIGQPVQTGFLLGIGLGFALILWEAVRFALLLVFEGNIVTVALFGFLVLVVLLWVVVIAHHRKSRDADTRGGTG